MVTLHPFLSEMTRILCSNEVEIVELMGPAGDPHRFDPTPDDLAKVQDADVLVAMGKHLEPYLPRVQEVLQPGAQVIEAGKPVPSLLIDKELAAFACCPKHSHGAIDPHWWHDANAMRRAVRGLEKEFRKLLPEHAAEIKQRSRAYQDRLRELHEWILTETARIPRQKRKLVTAHAAFSYFCSAYGFQAVPVKGLDGKREPSQEYLASTIQIIRKEKVVAVFPEVHANQNALELIQRETGAKLGQALLADNAGAAGVTYETFMRTNVRSIVQGLLGEVQ